ncbi:MAG: aminomethyl transferase family protein [Phycisphaerales bacterium]|nr:MAG: aminomethyl transferase family protein [Phycisphaerales bacterium]
MARTSPIHSLHVEREASLAIYGPPAESAVAPSSIGPSSEPILVVETFGRIELEYAALRRGCVLLDLPHRGVLMVTGADRLDFLNRMLTQDLRPAAFPTNAAARSFVLNRKGRVDADLLLANLASRPWCEANKAGVNSGDGVVLLDVDIHAASRAAAALRSYIVMDDAEIIDFSERLHRFALHGPTSLDLLERLADATPGARSAAGEDEEEIDTSPIAPLRTGEMKAITFDFTPPKSAAPARVVAIRADTTGEIGVELFVPVEAALAFHERALEIAPPFPIDGELEIGEEGAGLERAIRGVEASSSDAARIHLKPAGWHAFNIARIEAGTPLYNIDFGPESLPNETGVLATRVSMTKGCYLGQEVVARMHARGAMKQTLVALKFPPPPPSPSLPPMSVPSIDVPSPPPPTASMAQPHLPMAGDALFPAENSAKSARGGAGAVGTITSSTVSPMLGAAPIALAQVKATHTSAGTRLATLAAEANDETPTIGDVQATLRFWPASNGTRS